MRLKQGKPASVDFAGFPEVQDSGLLSVHLWMQWQAILMRSLEAMSQAKIVLENGEKMVEGKMFVDICLLPDTLITWIECFDFAKQ